MSRNRKQGFDRVHRAGVGAALGCVVLAAGAAQAQGDARRELIQRAVTARDAGDHATALTLFEQAGVIEMRPGLRLSIAQEQQALGRARASCETSSLCVAELQSALGSPESARMMPACAEIAAQTCRGFGRVRVSVAAALATGSAIRVQDRTVTVAHGEAQAFVEPGPVRVELVREGRTIQTRNLDATAGATVTTAFEAEAPAPPSARPPLAEPVAEPVAPPRSAAVVTPVVTPHPAAPEPAASTPITSRWWFWTAVSVVVIGGTLGGLAAGGVLDGSPSPPEGLLYTVNALRGW